MLDFLKKLTVSTGGASRKTVVFSVCAVSFLTGSFLFTSTHSSEKQEETAFVLQRNALGEPSLTQAYDAPLLSLSETENKQDEETDEKTLVELPEESPAIIPDNLVTAQIGVDETLSQVLRQKGIKANEIHKITEALSEVLNLKQIQVGDTVEIGTVNAEDGTTPVLFVTVENRHGFKYTATRNETDSFESSLVEPKVDIRTEFAESEISGNFVNSAKQSGIPTNVIQQIIWAFDGPIDFKRDLRQGDTFSAVFQKEYNMQGNPTGNGSLIYASFKLKVGTHERYLYKDSKGAQDYYDETGKIARRLLVMHPLARPRITSSYGKRRHPVLRYTIMHWGTDFGAPTGTPIRAPGDAVITFMGTRGGYGKYIQLKHNSEYSTAYAHMSRYNSSLRVGQKIKAGRIIGYVGNTGRSTGPHLHWEMIKNGRKINPTLHKITSQKRLKGKELKLFKEHLASLKNNLLDSSTLVRAQPLKEDRKLAYQPEKKIRKVARKKAHRRVRKTASRQIKTRRTR